MCNQPAIVVDNGVTSEILRNLIGREEWKVVEGTKTQTQNKGESYKEHAKPFHYADVFIGDILSGRMGEHGSNKVFYKTLGKVVELCHGNSRGQSRSSLIEPVGTRLFAY